MITIGWTDAGIQGAPNGLRDGGLAERGPAAVVSPPPAASSTQAAAEAWPLVKDSTDVAALEAFIRRHGDNFLGDLARTQLERVKEAERRLTREKTAGRGGAIKSIIV